MDGQAPTEAEDRHETAGPRVAVAFSGGGARGLAHIHVIEALDELGIRPVAIAGSSIGAIMGAAMASGMSGKEVRASALATLGNRTEVLSRFWRLAPGSMRAMMSDGLRIGQFDIERMLKAFLPERIPHSFAHLPVPLKVVATDYYANAEAVIEHGELFTALAASSAMPAIFRPVRCEKRVMIDGGISNPLPFDHLRGLADIVIAVDVVGTPAGDPAHFPSRLDSLFGAIQLMMQSVIKLKMREGAPDILLRPEVSRFGVVDFLKAGDILAASVGVRDDVRRELDRVTAHRR